MSAPTTTSRTRPAAGTGRRLRRWAWRPTVPVPSPAAAAFASVPSRPLPLTQSGRIRRTARRGLALLALLLGLGTVFFTFATPAQAVPNPFDASGTIKDIKNLCSPLNAPYPDVSGYGLDAFFDTRVTKGVTLVGTETYIPPAAPGYAGPAPTFTRYGMAGTKWPVYGVTVGCYDVNRYLNFVPEGIFTGSKMMAALALGLIKGTMLDPFQFLNEPIGAIAKAVGNIAAEYLGFVGAVGAVYLFLKDGAAGRRAGGVLKGIAWMGAIAGLFFWVQANPTLLGTKVNKLAAEFSAVGFNALSNLPVAGGADLCPNLGIDQVNAIACIQNVYWYPTVYEPWVYGMVGNDTTAAQKWGPQALNALYVGVGPDGKIDAKGQIILRSIQAWNAEDVVGGDSMAGTAAISKGYVTMVPWLKMWALDVCHNDQTDDKFAPCTTSDDGDEDGSKIAPEDLAAANAMSGGDIMNRFAAAGMSTVGNVIIFLTVYLICILLMAARLGLYVLMIFAPAYLMLGMFPGRPRVAAFALGEQLLVNLFRQVGWGWALCIVAYLHGLILQSDIWWVMRIITCALVTVLLALYARPAMRALSGMAMGNKEAGAQVQGVMVKAGKDTAKATAFAALAAASGGMSVAGASTAAAASGQRLGVGGASKAFGVGAARTLPTHNRWGSAVRGVASAFDTGRTSAGRQLSSQAERDRADAVRDTPGAAEGLQVQRDRRVQGVADQAAQDAIAQRRRAGDFVGADRLQAAYYDDYLQRTGGHHANDPRGPENQARMAYENRRAHLGQIDPARGVRPVTLGEDLMSQAGFADTAAAAANIDKVIGQYQSPANMDFTHPATPALRNYAYAVRDGLVPEQVRQAAVEAVTGNGLPDRIDVVAAPADAPITLPPQQVVFALNERVAAMPAAPNAEQRVAFIGQIEELARHVPAGNPVSARLNDMRDLVADAASSPEQLRDSYRNTVRAAVVSHFGDPAHSGPDASRDYAAWVEERIEEWMNWTADE